MAGEAQFDKSSRTVGSGSDFGSILGEGENEVSGPWFTGEERGDYEMNR